MPHREQPIDLLQLFGSIRGAEQDYQQLLSGCAFLFEADGASLFVNQLDEKFYRLVATFGTGKFIPDDSIVRDGYGLAGYAMEREEPLLVGDPNEFLEDVPNRADLGSSMVIPLSDGNLSVGVLNLSRSPSSARYDHKDLERASQVGNVLSFLFSNARLVQQLEASRSKVASFLKLLGIATFIFNAEGDLTDANESAYELLHTRMSWEGLLESLPPTLSKAAREAFQASFHSLGLVRRSANLGDLHLEISAMGMAGGGCAMTIADVTERHRLLMEVARNARLAEIGQLTATVAHELRNPLTSIRGAGQMLASLTGNAGELGKIVLEETLKLNRLCDDFLDISKPMVLHSEQLALGTVLEEVVHQFDDFAKLQGVELSLIKLSDTAMVEGDRFRIAQGATNLISNAIQACEEGGHVEIVVDNNTFSVLDDGVGISSDDRSKLFTPFFTTKAKGTGLGLAHVKKVFDAHGASLKVVHKHQGTEFVVVFGAAA